MSVDSESSLTAEVILAVVRTPVWAAAVGLGTVATLGNLAVAGVKRLF